MKIGTDNKGWCSVHIRENKDEVGKRKMHCRSETVHNVLVYDRVLSTENVLTREDRAAEGFFDATKNSTFNEEAGQQIQGNRLVSWRHFIGRKEGN